LADPLSPFQVQAKNTGGDTLSGSTGENRRYHNFALLFRQLNALHSVPPPGGVAEFFPKDTTPNYV